ncbi:UNVERIFIED_CONTAM: hypothetical protein FKN15_021843 [Acipenser sinensis]
MGLGHFLAWMVWGLVNPAFAFSMSKKPLSIKMPTAVDQGNTTVAVTTNVSDIRKVAKACEEEHAGASEKRCMKKKERSQENLLRIPSRGRCSEPQVYPHMVLQRVPTPTAPVYLHLPAQPADSHTQIMSSYTNPAYCSPQRHYQ